MKLALLLVATAALALTSSCSHSGTTAVADGATNMTTLTPAKAMELSLVDRMFLAPKYVQHGGLRHVEYELESPNGLQRLDYLERVAADGKGHFALSPVRVLAPVMNANQRETFELIQKQREGFFFSYRDFGVRDRALFEANYRVVTVPTTTTILGRDCVQLEIRRVDPAPTWYLVSVDSETGLVLRCTEHLADGRILSRTEFTELSFQPDLQGVEWFEPQYTPGAAPLTATSAAKLAFVPAEPRFLPNGFHLVSSDVVSAEGDPWVRRVYGDGVESLFVLHKHRRDTAGGYTQAITDSSSNLHAGTPIPSDAPTTVTVRLCQVGPWTMAEATRDGEQIFVVGKMAESDVVRVLQSTL